MKGKIIINVTLIWFERTGKTISLNSILEFSIISDFKMRIVIIWHWFIKNLVGTWRQNDVDATSLRRIDVITTSCACWEFGPPWPPQYSKPSYAYVDGSIFVNTIAAFRGFEFQLIGAYAYHLYKRVLLSKETSRKWGEQVLSFASPPPPPPNTHTQNNPPIFSFSVYSKQYKS